MRVSANVQCSVMRLRACGRHEAMCCCIGRYADAKTSENKAHRHMRKVRREKGTSQASKSVAATPPSTFYQLGVGLLNAIHRVVAASPSAISINQRRMRYGI